MEMFNILIAGVVGQGNVLISRIIGRAALNEGHPVWVGETFGMGQRGGPVVSHIRLGRIVPAPVIPEYQGDVVLGLEPVETLRVACRYLKKGKEVIINPRPVMPTNVTSGKGIYPPLEVIKNALKKITPNIKMIRGTDLAQRAGNPLAMNMVMLGALAGSGKMPISIQKIREVLKEEVPKGTESSNLKAFDLGIEAYQKE